ncbi:COP9 signalosome complex subunit 3 [Iris pallida]|uniref:COP9 signalosome complex subunit 3 n=1 Tax=Iris pallida TaxID=29817 RepID=A0AAX6EVI6_IRIPA|nr:COP9 signalosome complex subunit 3 [Iris pallida]
MRGICIWTFSREQASGFLLTIVNFINSCAVEQIRLAPDKFFSICKKYKYQVLKLQVPTQGVAPLRTAICKIQSSAEHLTSLHSDFLLLCILSKCYKSTQSILDEDIFEVDQPRDSLPLWLLRVDVLKNYFKRQWWLKALFTLCF